MWRNGGTMVGLDLVEQYHIPRTCRECGGVMVFKGVGEYQCENCGFLDYDDYGKVRAYIEEHNGATAMEIEAAIGVSQKTIRRLLRESRIQVAEGSKSFLHCERCGQPIRSGRYCPQCEMTIHRNMEEKQREQLRRDTKGYSKAHTGDDGHRRFVRGERQQ